MFKKSVWYFLFFLFFSPYPIFAEEENKCKLPYKPNNIFTVIFNYSEGMTYISSAKETCSNTFAQELAETFRESFWVSQGCLEVTLQDIEKAKTARKDKLALNAINSPKLITSN
jgi:hypothetical protein